MDIKNLIEGMLQKSKDKDNSIRINTGQMEVDMLNALISYPGERHLNGTIHPQPGGNKYSDRLETEIRLMPADYESLEKDALQSNEIMVDMTDTLKLMDRFYVENVPMSKVTELLLHHPDMNTDDLKDTLQLFDLMKKGVDLLEDGKQFTANVNSKVNEVRRDLQHIYTGEHKPLEGHEYYKNDIRPIFDRELKEMAELSLREMGMIQTRPQSFHITWSNGENDGWECREMVKVINERYQDYRGFLAKATQTTDMPNSPEMRLDIHTTRPEWRKQILDTVQKSWAMKDMKEITNPAELPYDIYVSKAKSDEDKKLEFKYAGVKDAMYVFETGTDGFAIINQDRSVKQFGEDFTPKHKAALDLLLTRQNVPAVDGSLFLKPIGTERIFLDKSTGQKINAIQETVNGKEVLVQPYKLRKSPVEGNLDKYVEVTGRVTEAKVIGKDDATAIRCKIDGVQCPATRISWADSIRYKNGGLNEEQLAIKYFTPELMKAPEQERNQSMKR